MWIGFVVNVSCPFVDYCKIVSSSSRTEYLRTAMGKKQSNLLESFRNDGIFFYATLIKFSLLDFVICTESTLWLQKFIWPVKNKMKCELDSLKRNIFKWHSQSTSISVGIQFFGVVLCLHFLFILKNHWNKNSVRWISRRFVHRPLCLLQTSPIYMESKNRENFIITNSNYKICSRFPFNKIEVVEIHEKKVKKKIRRPFESRIKNHLDILQGKIAKYENRNGFKTRKT